MSFPTIGFKAIAQLDDSGFDLPLTANCLSICIHCVSKGVPKKVSSFSEKAKEAKVRSRSEKAKRKKGQQREKRTNLLKVLSIVWVETSWGVWSDSGHCD